MSMRGASKGLAIGWGEPPRGSHANLETIGEPLGAPRFVIAPLGYYRLVMRLSTELPLVARSKAVHSSPSLSCRAGFFTAFFAAGTDRTQSSLFVLLPPPYPQLPVRPPIAPNRGPVQLARMGRAVLN